MFLLVSLWYLRQSQSLGSTPVTVTNRESLSKGPTHNARVGLYVCFLSISVGLKFQRMDPWQSTETMSEP